MTTAPRPAADWKLTEGRRVLTVIGWAALIVAVYGLAAAIVVGVAAAWWMAIGAASVALVVSVALPSPVPRDLLSERHNRLEGVPWRG